MAESNCEILLKSYPKISEFENFHSILMETAFLAVLSAKMKMIKQKC